MAIQYADRVRETTTTTGTGTYALAGATTGFQGFVAGIGDTNQCYYCVTDGTDWETGIGTVADGSPDTLARNTIIASSNAGAAVNWGAGSKDVFVVAPAIHAAKIGMPRGYIDGLTLANNTTDANNDIDISAGACRDDSNADDIALASASTKRLDAAWAVGTNQGGLDAGSKAVSTWYHVWLIKRSDTGVVDVLFSTSATAPTMPADYDLKRRLGAVRTDASGNILPFLQRPGGRFIFGVQQEGFTSADEGTSAILKTLPTPLGVRCQAILALTLLDATYATATYALLTDPAQADTAPAVTATTIAIVGNGGTVGFNAVEAVVGTNESSQVRMRMGASQSDIFLRCYVKGWIDSRGRDG